MPKHYLNRNQLEDRVGLARGAGARMELPEEDVTVGPINPDGTLPRGTVRGWLPATIDAWDAERPKRKLANRDDGS